MPAVVAELARHFTSTWALRDDLAADASKKSPSALAHASDRAAVAKSLLAAFVFPVTVVVSARGSVRVVGDSSRGFPLGKLRQP
jgi:hypothetical protein